MYRRKQCTEGSSEQCTEGSSVQKEVVTSVQKEAVYRRKQSTEGGSDQCTEGSSVQKEAVSSVQQEAVYRRKKRPEGSSEQHTEGSSVQKEAVYRRKQCTEGSSVPRHVAGWCRTGDLTHVRRCRLEEGHDDMVEHQGNIVESQQDQQTKLVTILSTECCYQTIQVLKLHDELSVSRRFTRNPEIQKAKDLSYLCLNLNKICCSTSPSKHYNLGTDKTTTLTMMLMLKMV